MTLEEWKNDFKGFINELSMPKDDYNGIMEYIDEVPNETRWIPVSEKLPQELDYVLCCDKDGYMTIGFVSEKAKDWCFVDAEIDIDVVAWMPLPQPYEPKESD